MTMTASDARHSSRTKGRSRTGYTLTREDVIRLSSAPAQPSAPPDPAVDVQVPPKPEHPPRVGSVGVPRVWSQRADLPMPWQSAEEVDARDRENQWKVVLMVVAMSILGMLGSLLVTFVFLV